MTIRGSRVTLYKVAQKEVSGKKVGFKANFKFLTKTQWGIELEPLGRT